MAKSKTKRRRKNGFTLPLAIVGGFTVPAGLFLREWRAAGLERAVRLQLPRSFLAFEPLRSEFRASYLSQGITPILAGFLIHWFVGKKLGVNRALSQARVPVFRV